MVRRMYIYKASTKEVKYTRMCNSQWCFLPVWERKPVAVVLFIVKLEQFTRHKKLGR